MNRTTYILIALAAMIAFSCTKATYPMHQEDLSTPYIFFDAEILQTKSNLLTGESLPSAEGTAFGVFGYKGDDNSPVFDMYKTDKENTTIDNVAKMYRPSVGAAFIYKELALWTNQTHSFYAYYPYTDSKDLITDAGMDPKPYITYTQPTSLDTMVDLMTAYVTGQPASTNPVQLNFQHRLFALDVIIVNEQIYSGKTDLVIKSASITFTDVCNGAKLYLDGAGNSNNEDKVTITYTPTVPISIAPPTQSGETWTYPQTTLHGENSFLFLPATSLKVKVTINATDEWGKDDFTIEETIAPEGGLQAGKKYALVISKIDGEGFVATVPDWTDFDADIEFKFQ